MTPLPELLMWFAIIVVACPITWGGLVLLIIAQDAIKTALSPTPDRAGGEK